MQSAHRQSLVQAQTGQMTHEDPIGHLDLAGRMNLFHIEARRWAENVAQTSTDNVDDVMESWLASPGHLANILGSEYTHFGSAAVNDGQTFYWTQHFATVTAGEVPCLHHHHQQINLRDTEEERFESIHDEDWYSKYS